MICFSRDDIEKISLKVIKKYKCLPELHGMSITRIDPTLLAESLMGLTLDFVHLSLTGNTLGLTSLDETGVEVYDETDHSYMYMLDGNTILVESDLKSDCERIGRCNFSIMHEASHQLFGKLYPKEYGAGVRNRIHYYRPEQTRSTVRNWEEWQANVMASALLMPKDILLEDMKMFDLGERIDILNSRYRPETFMKFRFLAQYLGVSMQALAIRMEYLHLLDREYLNRANDMILIYPED